MKIKSDSTLLMSTTIGPLKICWVQILTSILKNNALASDLDCVLEEVSEEVVVVGWPWHWGPERHTRLYLQPDQNHLLLCLDSLPHTADPRKQHGLESHEHDSVFACTYIPWNRYHKLERSTYEHASTFTEIGMNNTGLESSATHAFQQMYCVNTHFGRNV